MTSLPKVAIAQLGARRHYQEPILFHQWGILETLYTDFYAGNSLWMQVLRLSAVNKRLPNSVKSMTARFDKALQGAEIITFPVMGYQYARDCKKANTEEAAKLYENIGEIFCERIIEHGLSNANTVYGFNSACLELFKYAKQKGLRCILDQTLVERSYLHLLLLEEEKHWPNWSSSQFNVSPADQSLADREWREQDLSDQIICGSSFVKDSLIKRGVTADKIYVMPLGRELSQRVSFKKSTCSVWGKREEGLHILFCGSVGLRKGMPYLLEALRQLKGNIPFVCKAAGSIELRKERLEEYSDVCQFLGRLPRSEIAELYEWADVFVLPSLCEGSAMVTYEALQHGLPVITTYNSGSISEKLEGNWTVPIRNSQAISEALTDLFHNGFDNTFSAKQKQHIKIIRKEALAEFRRILLGLDN
jgi:glycosyltransferase involved in cell wall biosynthesis